MDSFVLLRYFNSEDNNFDIKSKEFVTFLGQGNKKIIDNLIFDKKDSKITINNIVMESNNLIQIRKNILFCLNKHLDIFVGETVKDEIAFGLESLAMTKDDMIQIIDKESIRFKMNHLLSKDPNSLGSSDKAKLKILNAIVCKPKIIVLDNILCELDYLDKKNIINILKEYVESGNVILNFTSEVEETLIGDRVIITDEDKLLIDGKTMSVLNEEKIMKRLGFSLPFIVELNKYLMDYNLINKYILDTEKLVDKLWK